MKLRIEIRLDNTGETLSSEKVHISTNPDDIAVAKEAAAENVERAVDKLMRRALEPLKENELREVIL